MRFQRDTCAPLVRSVLSGQSLPGAAEMPGWADVSSLDAWQVVMEAPAVLELYQ